MFIGQLVNQVIAALVTKLDGTQIDTYTDDNNKGDEDELLAHEKRDAATR